MSAAQKPGTHILVTGCANRELPPEVQSWLRQQGAHVVFAAHIYDALAELVCGRRPYMLLVHIDALDWNELDFFTHATRLSRETRIFVVGPEHRNKKMEAACARGAQIFTIEQAEEYPVPDHTAPAHKGTGDLLAGSLPPSNQYHTGDRERNSSSLHNPSETAQESPASPTVRLVRPYEDIVTDDENQRDEQNRETAPVAFPWSPAKNRPTRTPPKQEQNSSSSEKDQKNTPASPDTQADKTEQSQPQQQPQQQPINLPGHSPVMLTPEELEALTGQWKNEDDEDGHGREQNQC